jgi:hypothetical protein
MMNIRHSEFMAALVLCSTASCLCSRAAAQPVVKEIVIRSEWGGFAIPPHRETIIEILRSPAGKYQSSNGTTVEDSRVATLVSAIRAIPNRKVDLRDLGIDRPWLVDKFAVAEKDNDELQSHEQASESQRDLFRQTFESPAKLEPIVANLFSAGRYTDDNPCVQITVTFEDGSVQQAQSNSQYEFMLPWRIKGRTGPVDGFNRDISRAIVALMPDGSTNRERLNGDAFPEVLGAAVMEAIQNDWNLLEVEGKYPEVLTALRERYKLRTATISGDYAIEYGREWSHDQPQETNVQAVVSRPEFPSRFDETVVFEKTGEQVVGVDQFLKQAYTFEGLSLSVPWLTEYLKAHPGVSIHLYYVHSASLAERGLKVFRADMRTIGRGPLATKVIAIQDKVALLVVDENNGQTFTSSHWIVLPDHRMVLWRFSGPQSTLAPFPGHECSRDDPEAVGGCVGRVKLPSGEWQLPD